MDFHTFIIQLKQYASHPMIKFLIMPLTLMLYGTNYGSRIGRFNLLGTCLFYLFMFSMQLVEQYLFVNDAKRGYIRWQPLLIFEVIVGVLLVALYFTTNIIFAILAFLYVVSIHVLYTPYQLKGSIYYIILQVFLKAVVLTILASFIQINQITLDLLVSIIPLIFVLLFYYTQSDLLDKARYGLTHLSKKTLKLLSYIGLIGAYVIPYLIGKLAIGNWLMTSLFLLLALLMLKFTTDDKRYIKVGKSKNYMTTLYTLYIVLLCLL